MQWCVSVYIDREVVGGSGQYQGVQVVLAGSSAYLRPPRPAEQRAEAEEEQALPPLGGDEHLWAQAVSTQYSGSAVAVQCFLSAR